MKKLLAIVIFGLFFTNNTYSNDKFLGEFNRFLYDKGFILEKEGFKGIKKINICKDEKKYSKKWYDSVGRDLYERCENKPDGVFVIQSDLKIKFFKGGLKSNKKKVNKDTLLYYTFYQLKDDLGFTENISVEKSKNPYEFEFDLRENKDVKKEINSTGLLSYLLFENDKIVIDEITPKDRIGILFDNETKWASASVGKSIVSYVTGHAICGGYIESINSEINDWPLIKNTLYDGQKLINLLNMAAGDQKLSRDSRKDSGDLIKHKETRNRNPNNNTLKFHMSDYFKNSKKSKSKYNYSNIIPNIVLNYVYYKSNGDFQKILDNIFKEKVGIENSFAFMKMNSNTVTGGYTVNIEDGPIRYSFRASRYDYLRIAKAMLDDWNNDTCVGKYLKTIYENRIPKNDNPSNFGTGKKAQSYGGFFHTDFSGIDRPILGMSGYAGQTMVIDPERSRIFVINAVHNDYNWKKIVYSVIKDK